MTKYKIRVSFDKTNFFWIVVDTKNKPPKIIHNPTKEDLKDTKNYLNGKYPIKYNDTNICNVCREEYDIGNMSELTDKCILYPGNACKDVGKDGDKTEIYVCHIHYNRNKNRYDPNSWDNVSKTLASWRTENLHTNSTNYKGDLFEELTYKWLGAKRLTIEYNNHSHLSLDHSPIPNGIIVKIRGKLEDLSGKIIETKGRFYNLVWNTGGNLEKKWYIEFDYLILYCASKDRKFIERIYIIPKKEIYDPDTKQGRTGISINKNPTDSRGNSITPWYEQYRVIDEETIKKVNDIWKQIA